MKYRIGACIVGLWCIGCSEPSGEVISKIPEASGIDYCASTNSLIVANDEGSYYEIDTEGKILRHILLGKYDLEGVVCQKDTVLFALENKGLLFVDTNTGATKEMPIDDKYEGKSLKLFAKKAGVEGITKVGNTVYLAKQSKNKKESFIAVVELTQNASVVVDVIEHHLADTAGLTLHEGYLYMVSDKEDVLIVYDIKKNKSVQKIKLGEGAWEGIAFDEKGDVYLADDDGRIVKQTKKAMGL